MNREEAVKEVTEQAKEKTQEERRAEKVSALRATIVRLLLGNRNSSANYKAAEAAARQLRGFR